MAHPKKPKTTADFPPTEGPQPAVDADWAEKLYTPERIKDLAAGKLTPADFHAITWYELLDLSTRAFSYFNEGKYKEAGVLFRGLISLEPKEAYYRLGLGAVLLAEDKLQEARELFDQAVKLNPKDRYAYLNRGECHLKLGDIEAATQDLKKVIDLDPAGTAPETLRARMLAAAALESVGGAPPKPTAK